MKRTVLTAMVILAALGAGACSDSPDGPESPASLEALSGGGQEATVGAQLPDPLVVLVQDDDGDPVANAAVSFVVTSGGGTLLAATATTGADGRAENRWTLGGAAGPQTVEARLVSEGQPLTAGFTATARAAAPAQTTLVGAGTRTGSAGAAVADSLAVRVVDSFGNPVPGVQVTWTVTAGSGTVSPGTSTTGADGIARASWTLGLAVGVPESVRAAVPGTAPVVFDALSSLPANAVVEVADGAGQTTPAGSAFPENLVARVRLPDGRPLANVPVTWSASRGTLSPASTVTNASGLASAVWTAGTAAGAGTARAMVPGGAEAVFSGTVAPASPSSFTVLTQGIRIQAGEQADSLRIRVSDRFGNPVPGLQVSWSLTAGQGTFSPNPTLTGADGTAATRLVVNTTAGRRSVRASVAGTQLDFAVDVDVAAADTIVITPATATLAVGADRRLDIAVYDRFGNRYPNSRLGESLVTWESLDPEVAHVLAEGNPFANFAFVAADAPGTARIRATFQGVSATAVITVP